MVRRVGISHTAADASVADESEYDYDHERQNDYGADWGSVVLFGLRRSSA